MIQPEAMSTAEIATEEEEIPITSIRPRFKLELKESPEELSKKIKTALEQTGAPCLGKVKPNYAALYPRTEDQHYWSPQMSLSFLDSEEGEGCTLYGLIGPRPTIWTMFVFFYSAVGFAAFIIAMIGLTNMTLEKPNTILWTLPALGLVFFSIYLVAYFGKKKGHDQMHMLHEFVEKSLEIKIHPH